MKKFGKRLLTSIAIFCISSNFSSARADVDEPPPLPQPQIRAFAGAWLGASHHNYWVESEIVWPFLVTEQFSLQYRREDITPFLDLRAGGIQAELLYRLDEISALIPINPWLELKTVARFEDSMNADRAGNISAYSFGAGIGSPADFNAKIQWSLLAGTYIDRKNLTHDWWFDASGRWRAYEFSTQNYLDGQFAPALTLSGRFRAAVDDDAAHPLFEIGPNLEFSTAHGNRAELGLHWLQNSGNPFYGRRDNGVLFGINLTSSRKTDAVFDARTERKSGVLPLVWGSFEAGSSMDRRISQLNMDVELLDFKIAEHPFTAKIWYSHRQDYNTGDFDNTSYSVTLGIQTLAGLQPPPWDDQPLVLGIDFFHRSDHALAADAARVAAEGSLVNGLVLLNSGSINLFRLRLQSRGWDLPYRDPSIYNRNTRMLLDFDWRVTMGYDSNSSRERDLFTGQIGLNCDIATIEGYVIYLLGIGSIGNESPDWLGEFGVRRPAFKVFVRTEDYGIAHVLSRGNLVYGGVGINL
jgi:hypothetical protein